MKQLIFTLILLASFIAHAEQSPWDYKLPFKEAAVEYKVDGSMKGSKTIYIRDYGRTSATYTNTSMSMFGIQQKQQEIVIATPDWVYSYDLIARQGSKQVNPTKLFNEEYAKLSKSDQKKVMANAEKFGVSSVEGLQGKVQKGAVKFLGYECDVTNAMGTEVYSIADTGFPLKMTSQTMGVSYSEEAISIKKGAVSDDKFSHPKGIKAVHNKQADAMMRTQVKSIISQLRSGEMSQTQGSNQQMGIPSSQPGNGSENDLSTEEMQQLQKMMQMFGGGQ